MSKNDEVKRPLVPDGFAPPPERRVDPPRQAWIGDATRAVDDRLMGDIVRDSYRSRERSGIIPASASSGVSSPHRAASERGWVDPQPLVSGKNRYIEAQLDAQAAQDRAELERKLGRQR
jgi:hypothetical protein